MGNNDAIILIKIDILNRRLNHTYLKGVTIELLLSFHSIMGNNDAIILINIKNKIKD